MSDTYRILLDGTEVARLTGEGIAFGKRGSDTVHGELLDDPKMLKKTVETKFGTKHTLFVLMLSSQKNVTVEKVVDDVPKS